jgi:hypothetical protein
MSLGFVPLRRRFERLLATLSAVAVFMSMMVIFAPAALAHHPEVTAFQTCLDEGLSIHYDAISWRTDGGSGSGHPDIRIEVRVNGAGSWSQVDSGAFTTANSYRFSGDFGASPYLGESIEVRARAVGAWDNGQGGNETWVTSPILVSLDCTESVSVTPAVQVCVVNQQNVPQGAVSFGIDPASGATVQVYLNSNFTGPVGGALGDGVSLSLAPGTYYWQATPGSGFQVAAPASGQFTIASCGASTVVVDSECAVAPNGAPVGQVQVTIDPTSGATVTVTGPGGPYNFSGAGGSQQLVPGQYSWQATPGPGFSLTGPSSGQFTIDPCTGSVIVSSGVCDLIDGPLGPVEVTIDPDDAATVTVFSDAAMTNEVAFFEGEGGSTTLVPGTYYWAAEAESGFELEGATQGQFTIQPCEASTVVVSEGCALNVAGLPVGLVEVTIDPDSGAIVVVTGPGGPYNFSGSGGSQELAPGSYAWEATAASGFALTGDTSGDFDIEPCDVSVLVGSGECQSANGPLGSVTVFIDAESGATVTVYDADLNVAAAFSGVGGTGNLAPGTYTWVATPGDGFEFPQDQPTSGEFTIAPCPSTVLVTQGACLLANGPRGSVFVQIDPAAGAAVTVRDGDLKVVATFSGSGGSIGLPSGSYTWTVEAADGFSVIGDTSGRLTLEPCGASVIVTHGNCAEDAPTAFGSVTVGITPEAAAAVTILDSSQLKVAVFGDAGGQQTLPAGDYTWSAVAAPGFQLTGATSGAFEVVACPDEVRGVTILPFTGMDSEILLGVSILLLGMGIYLIHIARRGEEG